MRADPVPLTPLHSPTLPTMARFSTSQLHTDTGGVLQVAAHGDAVLLTRHKRPAFVLMTVEHYCALEARSAPMGL